MAETQSNILNYHYVALRGIFRIALSGEFQCLGNVVLEVKQELATRYRGNILQVRGVSYNYVARIPGRHLVLKYHNWHDDPDIYIHRAYNPRTGQQILYEELTRRQFPVLSEILDEAAALTRDWAG